MHNFLFNNTPFFIHNFIITIYNLRAYRVRHGGNYKKYFNNRKVNLSLEELKQQQNKKLKAFVNYAFEHSCFYQCLYENVDIQSFRGLEDLNLLPILDKETLRKNIKDVYTIKEKNAVILKTGGTTGKPLKVCFTKNDTQKRNARLDVFRSQYGYKLGEKTAWFSGKKLLNKRDINKNRFWKFDFLHKVRYYSTFHCSGNNLKFIISDLNTFSPKYIVGFPSNLYDISKYGLENQVNFCNTIKAIFPTAETVTKEMRESIETFFKTKIYDQYASSEGAPFIFECKNNKLHLDITSGVFEVLDDNQQPTTNGRMIITSFTTSGTPLIRYDIGDNIALSQEVICSCGNSNPIVDRIEGRINDFIYSPYTGKINLGNISNSLKGVNHIKKFQINQNEINKINVSIEIDEDRYSRKDEMIFKNNLYDRFGKKMIIEIKYLDKIPREKSGKFRLVKNNIYHLLVDK